jgi:hypothetical protein
MTDLIFKGDISTDEGKEEFEKHLEKLAEDPDIRDILLRMMESALDCKHDSNTCPYTNK